MPEPIRVLHPITRLIVGGAQENTLLTADHLVRDPAYAGRYVVDVACGPETGPEGSLLEEAHARGVSLTILPALKRALDPVADVRAYRSLVRMMRRPDGGPAYDIVHTHSSKAGVLGRLAARAARVPVVVHTVHGWSFHDRMPRWRRAAYVALERHAARAGHRLIVVTSLDIDKGLSAGVGTRGDYVVVRSGIELERFGAPSRARADVRRELGFPDDTVVAGSITRLSPQKAPLDLVAAFAAVARARPGVRFVIVGDGPDRRAVESALAASGLADLTVLTGVRRDVPELLSAMDVFVLSSHWEGLPRVIPQAMTAGLPVVATGADGTREIIRDGETGYLVSPGRPAELARRIIALVDDPDTRRALGDAGRAAATPFGVRQMVADLDTIYQELSARRGRASVAVVSGSRSRVNRRPTPPPARRRRGT